RTPRLSRCARRPGCPAQPPPPASAAPHRSGSRTPAPPRGPAPATRPARPQPDRLLYRPQSTSRLEWNSCPTDAIRSPRVPDLPRILLAATVVEGAVDQLLQIVL